MEVQIGNYTYTVGKLDARKQFHIVRRLTPVISGLAGAAQGADIAAIRSGQVKLDQIAPLAEAISRMSDEDADYVLFGLLGVVKRKMPQGTGWAPVSAGPQMMFDDIDMSEMLHLAWEAVSFNLGGFFAALPSDLTEASRTPSDPSAG